MCVFFYGPDKPELGIIYSALQRHAAQPSLNRELTQKSLKTFIDILDPEHFLFHSDEVQKLLEPKPGFIDQVHNDVTSSRNNDFHKNIQAVMAQRLLHFIKLLASNKDVRKDILDMIPKIELPDSSKITKDFPDNENEAYMAFVKFMATNAVFHKESAAAYALTLSDKESLVMAIRTFRGVMQTENYLYSPYFLPAIIAKSYVSNLDSHSDILLPKETYLFRREMSGEFFGVGVALIPTIQGRLIKNVTKGGGGERAGLKVGDVITHVEVTPQQRQDYDLNYPKQNPESNWVLARNVENNIFSGELVAGEKDSILKIKLLRGGKSVELSIQRSLISKASTKLYAENHPSQKGNIAYLKFDIFYNHSGNHFAEKIKEAQDNNSQGLVLDLRGNGGGNVDEMVKILSLFVKPGPAMIIKNSVSSQTRAINPNSKPVWDKPLIVLIDKFSASASEVLSGALQDYGRAIIVGSDSSSYGKGSMQQVIPLGNMTAAKLTTHLFSSPTGGHKQLDGVRPDILIKTPVNEKFEFERDLENALPALSISKTDLPPSYIPNRPQVIEAIKASQTIKSISEAEMKEAYDKKIDLVKEEAIRMMTKLIEIQE